MVWFPELRGKMEQEAVEGKANALPGMTGKKKSGCGARTRFPSTSLLLGRTPFSQPTIASGETSSVLYI